jgi:hypothetical protein
MSWPYLPVNPDCSASPCTPCSSCPTTSDLLTYAGPTLSNTEIAACDTLSVSLQKIEAEITSILALITALQAADVAIQSRLDALETYHP